jgi:hypothetical protein
MTKAQHTKGQKWIVDNSGPSLFMVIEEDGSDDGRLVADRLKKPDAESIAKIHNCHDELLDVCQMVASSIKVDELALITAARAAIAKATNPSPPSAHAGGGNCF